MIKSANLAFPNECFKWNQIMSWSPGQHKRKIRKGNPGLLGKYFVIINLLISEGTCVIFLKNSSAAISFEWDKCTCPVSTSRTFKMKITDLPGCWRLWRDPKAQWGWGRQTEALRKDVHFGQCYCRICLRLCEIKIKGAYVVCAETCSRRYLIPVIQFPLHFRFSSPQLWQRGSSSVWVLNWVHLQPEENSFYWEQCGSKGWEMQNSLRTPGFCGNYGSLFQGLPLPLKNCHQVFPLFWLHSCWDKTNHTPEVPLSVLHWETRVTIMWLSDVESQVRWTPSLTILRDWR